MLRVALVTSILHPVSALAGGSVQASIPFSSLNYGQPIGNIAPTTVGDSYSQSIYLGDGSSNYTISLANGWTLPSGLYLSYADGTPASGGLLQNASSFRISGSAASSGQYNLVFQAVSNSNPSLIDSAVYHLFVTPPASSFQGTVTTTMTKPPVNAEVLGFNQLVLPPGSLNRLYDATISFSNGLVKSVALVTQLAGGTIASAINSNSPVPGLVAGNDGNVSGLDQTSGRLVADREANVAGLTIKWSLASNTVQLGGIPKVAFGGLNDPLILQVTGPNDELFNYNLAMTYLPTQIAQAYGFDRIRLSNGIIGSGKGQTVVIYAIGDSPGFVSSTNPNFVNSDLHQFSLAHGLNSFSDQDGPIFLKVDQNGGTNYPINTFTDPTEVPQDIQWIHALAPEANIVVVEFPSALIPNPNIIQNWPFASIPAPSVVSSSFGGATLNGPDSAYVANVSYLASSGDFGSSGYANSSVVSVGYTQLKTTGNGDYSSEASVNGGIMQTTGKSFQSGGGSDSSQVQPTYQSTIPCSSAAANPVSSAYRTLPDVSFNGAEPSGLSVYNSLINTTATNFKTATSTQAAGPNAALGGAPWGNAWGTSIATPSWAALLAIANQGRALEGKPALDGATQLLPLLYCLAGSDAFNPIGESIDQTTQLLSDLDQANGTATYNNLAGLGSPVADKMVARLVAQASPTPVPGPLPLFGIANAWHFSRALKKRIKTKSIVHHPRS
jgi:subtilase family serine protease